MSDELREKVADLIDRLKLTSAWAFSMNGVPDDPEADTPMATIEDAIAALSIIFDPDAALSAMPTWRPIETAPRDGTQVDLWQPIGDSGDRIADCRWMNGCWREWGIGDFDTMDWRRLDGREPTHWTPLPAPPSEETGAEGEG